MKNTQLRHHTKKKKKSKKVVKDSGEQDMKIMKILIHRLRA